MIWSVKPYVISSGTYFSAASNVMLIFFILFISFRDCFTIHFGPHNPMLIGTDSSLLNFLDFDHLIRDGVLCFHRISGPFASAFVTASAWQACVRSTYAGAD